MSMETILGYGVWGIVIILILIIACQSGFQKKPAGIKEVISRILDCDPEQTKQDDISLFAAEAYSKMQEKREMIKEHEESCSASKQRRKELEDKLLVKIMQDLDTVKSLANTEAIIYTLKQNGAVIIYKFMELIVRVNEDEYKYTDIRKWCGYYAPFEAEVKQSRKENKEFCENALQYLLPWDSVFKEIFSGIRGEIDEKQEKLLAEAVTAETAEKEKERALLSRLGYDPDDPGAYDEAMKSIRM